MLETGGIPVMKINENEFAELLEELVYQARFQGGFISKDDINKGFESASLNDEQFKLVFDYLKAKGIGIDEPLAESDFLTREQRNIFEEYQKELSDIDIISESTKRVYVMEVMNNDNSHYSELVNYYLPKVIEIAKLYVGQGPLIEDLIGEGNLAVAEGISMLGAMEKPDEADGMVAKLIMDAMENLISEDFEENDADNKLATKVNAISDKAKELSEDLGRKVSVDELVENSSFSKKAIVDAIKITSNNIEYIDFQED